MLAYLSQAGPFHPKHGGGRAAGPPTAASSSSPHYLPPSEKEKEDNKISPLLPNGSSSLHHPPLAFAVHYLIAVPSIFCVHDAFFPKNLPDDDDRSHYDYDNDAREELICRRQSLASEFLLAYTLVLFCTRYLTSYRAGRLRHHSVLYELTWLCNSTLVMGCLSFGFVGGGCHDRLDDGRRSWLFRRRPLVATACGVAVSVDQVLWYVDLAAWIAVGKFPVGVMRYLTWEQTLWIDRFTCTHHLWTIPLLLRGAGAPLTWDSFHLSAYVVSVHVLLSRWMTPHCIRIGTEADIDGVDGKDLGSGKDDPQRYRYLNVNLSHELWKDISFPFLQISRDNPPCLVYFFRLLWRWQLFNGLIFIGILHPLSQLISA